MTTPQPLKIGIVVMCLLLIGCTSIEYGKVPKCSDLGVIGISCQPAFMFNQSKEPFCKQPFYDGTMIAEYELCQKGMRKQ